MYNGNGNRNGGTRGIRPLYLYIGIGALVLLGIWLIMSLLRPGIEGYFALAAGVLLLLGNVRDLLLPSSTQQRSNIALLNSMIGGSLVMFWLGKGAFPPIGSFWYIPAVLLLIAATPLIIGRSRVYGAYVNTARSLTDGARRVVGGIMSKTY